MTEQLEAIAGDLHAGVVNASPNAEGIEVVRSIRQTAAAGFLATFGQDVDADTPGRMARAYVELLCGGALSDEQVAALLKTFPLEGDPGIVLVRGIPFASVCEHHALPFMGTVDVAYIPVKKIVGLSKIPRLVRAVSRRFQVQERMGQQVADHLDKALAPKGVMVRVTGRHTCMLLRGIESPGDMVTSCVRGVFAADAAARAEALALME